VRLDKDPLDVALEIKRNFARTVARRRKEVGLDPEYLLGVAVWWLVIFAGLSIVGMSWIPAAIIAAIACWFWPIFLLLDRRR
jgi:hypothetical protein